MTTKTTARGRSASGRKGSGRGSRSTQTRDVLAATTACVPPADVDEELEVVGSLLWAAFARGAHPCTFGRLVVEEGRKRASANLRRHVEQCSLDLEKTIDCAYDCGREACRLAGGGEITVDHFRIAWELIKELRFAAIERLARIRALSAGEEGGMRGGACG